MLRVSPKAALPIARCDIYYSIDPDPVSRFWRSADVTRKGDVFTAKLPLESAGTPLYTYADVYYTFPKQESLTVPQFRNKPIPEVLISTTLHSVTPAQLLAAGM